MTNKFGNKLIWYGVVEDRMDPLYLGRCRVRIVGVHTDNKAELPTADLPWAFPLQPIVSAAVSGIGYAPVGPVEGTWVVVTFNDEEFQQPMMLGSIGGIPVTQSASATAEEISAFMFEQDEEENKTAKETEAKPESESKPPQTANEEQANGKKAVDSDKKDQPAKETKEEEKPTAATDDDLSKIPTLPPPDLRGALSSKREANIKAVIAACKEGGLTHRNAVAAVLGIIGGESAYIPQDELYGYTAERLKEIFSKVTPAHIAKYERAPKKGMSREEFFSFFYGPTFRGANFLGNKTDADGGKFYGRGFIQLTGRGNYERYAKLSGVDIAGSPSLLNTDIPLSAKVVVAYVKDRCKADPASSGYFDALKKSVGSNSKDIAERKRSYYEYFLGGKQPAKANDPLPEAPKDSAAKSGKTGGSESSQGGSGSKENSKDAGFCDPNTVYPKSDWLKEPDTHRLARKQKLSQTIHQTKKEKRTTGIPVANSGATWEQMNLPYNAKYPFNHVYVSECGHVMEFDDTEGAERIHIAHKSSTFSEIDPDGNKSERIVGGHTFVVDEDNLVSISGNYHTRVGSDGSLKIGGQFQLEVSGDCNIVVKGNLYQTVTGTTNIKSTGNLNIASDANINIQASGTFAVDAAQIHLNSGLSSPPEVAPTYSPNIVQPSPVTVEEAQFIESMEDDPERRAQVSSDTTEGKEPKVEKENKEEPKKQNEPVVEGCDFGELSYKTRLSENYTLAQLCLKDGNQADIFPFKNGQCGLSAQELACNLKQLCVNIIEPLRSKYRSLGFKVNSAFRAGSGNSQHNKGQAVDISFTEIRGSGEYSTHVDKFYDKAIEIRDSGLPYDQLIFEVDPGKKWVWIHLSFNPKGNRPTSDRSKVMSFNGKSYTPGIIKMTV